MKAALAKSYAWCKSLSRRRAGNFYFSFLTLPADRFRDMCVLYAFMRVCDDLGDDESRPVAERGSLLEDWRRQLDAALNGERTEHVAFPALVEVIERYQIPREYLHAVTCGGRLIGNAQRERLPFTPDPLPPATPRVLLSKPPLPSRVIRRGCGCGGRTRTT